MPSPAGLAQTALVVDDSEDVRGLMRLQLLFAGYRVLEARWGRGGGDSQARVPRLILTDINLPVMDGIAATRLLRQIEELCGVVIVACSALTGGDIRGSALAAGCDAYLGKTECVGRLTGIAERFLPAG